MSKKLNNLPYKNHFVLPSIAILIVLIGAYAFFAHSAHKWPFSPQKTATKIPPAYTVNQKGNMPPVGPDAGKTSDQVPVNAGLVATITDLSESNQKVNFSATITGSAEKGTCVVTFSTPNDRPITKQFDPRLSGQMATCGPLELPAQNFTYLGNWTATLRYYVGSEQATAQKELQIQ